MKTLHSYIAFPCSLLLVVFLVLSLSLDAIAQNKIYVNDDANGANTGLSWEDAYTNLHDALEEAEYGDQVWVAAGIYKPTNCQTCSQENRKESFRLKNGVSLLGGFSGEEQKLSERVTDSINLFTENPTILDGNIGITEDSIDNSFTLLTVRQFDSTAEINGLVFRNVLYNGNQQDTGGALNIRESDISVTNCIFEHNHSVFGGAINYKNTKNPFNVQRNTFLLRNCQFIQNHGSIDGGAVNAFSLINVQIERCNFILNTSTKGGALFSSTRNLLIDSCTFERNISKESGGGICAVDSPSINAQNIFISNTIFHNNKAKGNSSRILGGGLYCNSEVLKIDSCLFQGNESKSEGGGIYCGSGTDSVFIDNSRFFQNKVKGDNSTQKGGALSANRLFLSIDSSSFFENRSNADGGAIYWSGSKLHISNSSFIENIAKSKNSYYTEDGGAIFCRTGELIKINNSIFEKNSADREGGGIRLSGDSVLIHSTLFIGNEVNYENPRSAEGGALYAASASGFLELNLCEFKKNTASGCAGGLYISNYESILKDCTFSENISEEFGGAIFSKRVTRLVESKSMLSGCSFISNQSKGGGGIYLEDIDIAFTNCEFNSNSASSFGGAVFHTKVLDEKSPGISFNNCEFFENNAASGGCIYNSNSNSNLDSSIFLHNSASKDGGAIFNLSNSTIVKDCFFSENRASNRGGTIYDSLSTLIINKSTFLKNKSKSGSALFSFVSQTNIQNSTFSENDFSDKGVLSIEGDYQFQINNSTLFKNQGIGILLNGNGDPIIQSCIIAQHSKSNLINNGPQIISSGYNLISTDDTKGIEWISTDLKGTSINPLNPQLGQLRNYEGTTPTLVLLPESPAIGKGPPLSSADVLVDQRGYSRIIGSKNDSIDIGAFEYQETHTSRDITQICDIDSEFITLSDIFISDSTGGAWSIDSNQSVILSFPEAVELNSEEVEFQFLGEGLEEVNAFVTNNQINLVYNRSYTTSPNSIHISGLKIKAPLKAGFYDIFRSGEGTAIQNGNNLEDQASHGRIWVLPTVTNFPYEDSFEDTPIWQAELSSPLWQWGDPTDTRINTVASGQKVFMTNLSGSYEPNSNTWLYSPCLDLATLENPTLEFDYWADMENQIDGAVMQYSLDRGQSWRTLGSDSTGRSWYNSSSISANPGEQQGTNQFGWTGQSNGWKKAIHRLPDELRDQGVRLRLVFRSFDFVNPISQFNGFAIDNLSISDYQKNVFGELFVKEPKELAPSFTELPNQFENELLTITYPLFDPSTEVNSRDNFYGRSNKNTLILDGQAFYDPPSLVSYPEIDSLSLEEHLFTISYFPVDPLFLQVMAVVPIPQEITVQTVLVEKRVIIGNDTLLNVVRKFFPDPAGESISNWQEGETYTFNPTVNESNILSFTDNRPDDFQIVVFLQDATSKRIYQAESFPLSLVTSAYETEVLPSVQIFPNPVSDKLYISISPLRGQNLDIRIIDLQGRVLKDIALRDVLSIDVQNLPEGVYLLEIKKDSQSTIFRRFMIGR
ncbi:MAG: choice-of-anchor Q domain-containing protein [Bacteroidota bacterium]